MAALAVTAQEMLRVPWQKLDVLSKYQTTLDNQLYKAVQALRDTQAWRMKLIAFRLWMKQARQMQPEWV